MRVKRNYGVHKYADGGKVELNKGFKKGGKKKQSAISNYSGMSSTKQKMDKLGLKDGGKVEMKPPEKGGTPKRITTPGKPGETGPWGEKPARDRKPKKMACGGKVRH